MSRKMNVSKERPIFDKRLVLLRTSGPFAGLYCILGTKAQGLELLKVKTLPDFVPDIVAPPDDQIVAAGVVTIKPRFVLYKECAGPVMHRFDEFNPAQV